MQKAQSQYLDEFKSLRTRQEEMVNQQNNFYRQIKREQEKTIKEIEEVKKFQVNQTFMGAHRTPVEKLEERVHETRNEIIEMRKQIRDWTRNASSREGPYLFPSSLKQTWNKLDHASTSSKSQAKPTLQAPKFDPRFWGSKYVTSSLAIPRSRLSHVSNPNVTLQTPMQASQALPSFKQGHVWTKSQTWPKRESPPQGPRLAAIFPYVQ
ncbi:hypothetical protein PIB30_073203 [Stylosanthes scabra]|uniref:Uncharacterized protein n=1 Tax=Stylosanthes scabra TaxID=79078 RepID=A0ABU6QQG8_9FABA|nr:hypothetical protein [Stylosanthes scabra]